MEEREGAEHKEAWERDVGTPEMAGVGSAAFGGGVAEAGRLVLA